VVDCEIFYESSVLAIVYPNSKSGSALMINAYNGIICLRNILIALFPSYYLKLRELENSTSKKLPKRHRATYKVS
jgi:hypothetical protein